MNIPTKFFSEYSKFDLLDAMDKAEKEGNDELLAHLEEYADWRGFDYEEDEPESEYWYCPECNYYGGETIFDPTCLDCGEDLILSTDFL